MSCLLRGLLLAWLWLSAGTVAADEFKPAYLQLSQVDANTYEVLWKLPARDEQTTLQLRPVFPEGTRALTPQRSAYASGIAVQRWRLSRAGGLDGLSIGFDGLPESGMDVLVRVVRSDGSEQVGRVLPMDPVFTVQPSRGRFEVVLTYTWIGIEHILLGFDHLLFVLALVMIVRSTRMLLLTITAFTVAHSITLSLATLGMLRIPGPPVEAIIALSIVLVAAEILRMRRGHQGLAARKPWLVAFAFGLLHGLGFAGALAEVGLPANAVPLALLFFNVGVEIGQLAFIAAVLLLYRALDRWAGPRVQLARWAPVPAYAIGGIAAFWTLERIAGF